MVSEIPTELKSELMLLINERLYIRGMISRELYEQARLKIVKNERE